MRNADELSMTIAPAAAKRGASSRDDVAPAENSAMSRPDGSAVEASSTVISVPFHGNAVPAERADAKKRKSLMGKSRSARMARITPPTCPVAPTTPILMGFQANGAHPVKSRILDPPFSRGGSEPFGDEPPVAAVHT